MDTYRHDQGVKLSVDKSNRTSSKKKKSSSNKDVDIDEDENENDPLELQWIGLRPSHIEKMDLPSEVFQELTNSDRKRLDSLLVSKSSSKSKSFAERGGRNKAERVRELKAMRKYKVELEALHWKGMDYLCQFVNDAISEHELQQQQKQAANNRQEIMRRRRRQQKRRMDHSESSDSDSSDGGDVDSNHGNDQDRNQ